MAKSKKLKRMVRSPPRHHPYQKHAISKQGSKSNSSPSQSNSTPKAKTKAASQSAKPLPPFPLPFTPSSKILLVGEGDFTFSLSLSTHHGCSNLTCTTPESPSTLEAKHPSTTTTLSILSSTSTPSNNYKILFSIDATKLGLPHIPSASLLYRSRATYDCAIFNFPHIGGKSTDVNRQVRANQALVVGFLEGALRMLKPGGAAVVSLFEGMPYELWGVRNLARHVGFTVERSGRFEWERFPGYSHARTLGDMERGGWKGEEREARMFIFRKDGGRREDGGKGKGRRNSDESDENED